MQKYFSIIFSIIILAVIIGATIFWAQAFYSSVERYPSPLSTVELPVQTSTLPQTANVVVIVIGGLGYSAWQTLDMPVFNQLAQTGANALVFSSPPSYSQTAQMSLVTGAPPELNGAPPIDKPVEALSVTDIDTMFARAHDNQLKTAIAGPAYWRRLIPRNHLDETFFINASGPEADQSVAEAMLPALKSNSFDLIFIHLTQLDFAAKFQGGPGSLAYLQAADTVDALLGQFSRAIDTRHTVLMVVGDHGYTDSGGHGGAELEVIQQPFAMAGDAIVPGQFNDIHQTDIAPTITTLLGTAPPAAARGRILFEMFRMAEKDQTSAQLMLAQQRVALAEAYTTQILGSDAVLPETLPADIAQAQNAFAQNNIRGSHQLALLTQENADTQMAVTKYSHIQSKQRLRLVVSVALLGIWFVTLWRRRGPHAGLIILAGVVTIGLYHILYQLQGHAYSISALPNFTDIPFDIARRTAVSMLAGGGLLLVLLMLVSETDWTRLLGAGYGFSVLVTLVFALPLFWAFWQNGSTLTWYLPAVGTVFWQITALFEVMIAAILGLLLPWPIMIFTILVNWVRYYLDKDQSSQNPDTLPGLHL